MEAYEPPWWAPGPNTQTLFGSVRRGSSIAYERERWLTPDGDFVDVDWAGPEHAPQLLVLFHGLEGNSQSAYARDLARLVLESGCWRIAVPHFRSCSGELNWKARFYHSGDSDEIDWMLERFAMRSDVVCAAGISLGGNVLLKWLGEKGGDAGRIVHRAAAASALFDLAASGRALETGWGRAYSWYFLNLSCMRWNALRKMRMQQFRDEFKRRGIEETTVRAAETLPEYDDAMTAPLHDFGKKENYWRLASARPLLGQIRVPTLLLNARNDPFLPATVLPGDGTLPNNVMPDFPKDGGHAGFPGRRRWLARRLLEFLSPEPS
jgi:predicted alpha/beta-fold hydrolase